MQPLGKVPGIAGLIVVLPIGSLWHWLSLKRLLLVGRPSVMRIIALRVTARVGSLIALVICTFATMSPSMVLVLPLAEIKLFTAVWMELIELPSGLSGEQSPLALESPVGVAPAHPLYPKLVMPIWSSLVKLLPRKVFVAVRNATIFVVPDPSVLCMEPDRS